MLHGKGLFIFGVGAILVAGSLASFTKNNQSDDEKKKRYQVIHHQNGEVVEYDTILPMSSDYSVENFLVDKGIDNDNVEIIRMPTIDGNNFVFQDGEGEHKVVINEFEHEISVESDGEGTEEEMDVKIWCEKDNEGNVQVKKWVNGEEVELTEEEKEEILSHKGGAHHGTKKVKIKFDTDGTHEHEMEHKEVKIKHEIDDEGNTVTRKWVNGEEVEVTDEDLEKIEMHKDGGHMMIKIDSDEMSKEEMEKVMKELNIQVSDLEGEMEGLSEDIEVMVEKIMEEVVEGENGEQKIIVKKMIVDGEEGTEDVFIHEDADFVWESEGGNKEVRIATTDEDKDFTIVLVTENLPADATAKSLDEATDSDVTIYPNPNEGTFTISLNRKEKLPTKIEITDAQGRVVFAEDLGNFKGKYSKEVNLKKHGAGIYLVNIQEGDRTETQKVVIK